MSRNFPEGKDGLICTIQYALPAVDHQTYYKQAVHIADMIEKWMADTSRIPGTCLRREP